MIKSQMGRKTLKYSRMVKGRENEPEENIKSHFYQKINTINISMKSPIYIIYVKWVKKNTFKKMTLC